MSNKDNFVQQLQGLVDMCKACNQHRLELYLYKLVSTYYVTISKPLNVEYVVVKEKYQHVPPCCVNRWFDKALREAHHRLSNLLANDNTD